MSGVRDVITFVLPDTPDLEETNFWLGLVAVGVSAVDSFLFSEALNLGTDWTGSRETLKLL